MKCVAPMPKQIVTSTMHFLRFQEMLLPIYSIVVMNPFNSEYHIYLRPDFFAPRPDYFDGMVIQTPLTPPLTQQTYYCYIFVHYHPINIIWNVAKISG